MRDTSIRDARLRFVNSFFATFEYGDQKQSHPLKDLILSRDDKKGILKPGADADVVLLDYTFRVMKTFVKGKLVFERPWTN